MRYLLPRFFPHTLLESFTVEGLGLAAVFTGNQGFAQPLHAEFLFFQQAQASADHFTDGMVMTLVNHLVNEGFKVPTE